MGRACSRLWVREAITRTSRKGTSWGSIVHHFIAAKAVLDDRHQQDHAKQDKRQRRAVTIALRLVHLLENKQAGSLRGRTRPAACHDIDVVKSLKRPDDG